VAIEEHLKRQHVATRAARVRRVACAFLGSRTGNGHRQRGKKGYNGTNRTQVSHDRVGCTFRASRSARLQ
jgi:hypothetical protein